MDIESVTPIDFFELVITFSNGEVKIFSPGKLKLPNSYNFLAYPDKLKAFTYNWGKVTWFNGLSLESNFLYNASSEIATDLLIKKSLTIGSENCAPTTYHASHHIYYFSIYPFALEKQFVLGESIGGAHAEMGGCAFYSLNELIETPDYAEHLELANCSWVVERLNTNRSDAEAALNNIIVEVCRQASESNTTRGGA